MDVDVGSSTTNPVPKIQRFLLQNAVPDPADKYAVDTTLPPPIPVMEPVPLGAYGSVAKQLVRAHLEVPRGQRCVRSFARAFMRPPLTACCCVTCCGRGGRCKQPSSRRARISRQKKCRNVTCVTWVLLLGGVTAWLAYTSLTQENNTQLLARIIDLEARLMNNYIVRG